MSTFDLKGSKMNAQFVLPPSPQLAAALLTLTLTLSACGGDSTMSDARNSPTQGRQDIREFGSEATGSQAEQAEAAFRGYLDARAAARWSKACSYMTKSTRNLLGRLAARSKQIGGKGCAAFVESSAKRLSASGRAAFSKAETGPVRFAASRGYVLYTNAGVQYAMPIESEAGQWKLASSVGTPLKS